MLNKSNNKTPSSQAAKQPSCRATGPNEHRKVLKSDTLIADVFGPKESQEAVNGHSIQHPTAGFQID